MPTNVPYIFAGFTGNIPLSYLDANFANVKANVDNAGTANSALVATTAITASSATVATRAATVTTNAQPNITSVGTLNSLSVTGNIAAGNISIGGGSLQIGFVSANSATVVNELNANIINLPDNAGGAFTGTGEILVANGYPTLIAYGSGGHGGPEFDWLDSDDPNNDFMSAGVYRNSMYLNDTGLYVGINENLVAGNAVGQLVFDNYANLTVTGNAAVSGLVSVSGNITGGNVLTGGLISSTGNIAGGNLLATTTVSGASHIGSIISVSANITGGNIITAGLATVTGNITSAANVAGANLVTAGLITATGNVTGGNLRTGGQVSATANVTGGNIISSSVVNATGNAAILTGTAVPAGGTAGAGYKFSSTANFGIFFGSGAPTLSAAQGSLYLRTDGVANARVYVNNNGSTGWTGLLSA
jgi:hypothetical protein